VYNVYVLLYEGKCTWSSYGSSRPVDFPLNFIHHCHLHYNAVLQSSRILRVSWAGPQWLGICQRAATGAQRRRRLSHNARTVPALSLISLLLPPQHAAPPRPVAASRRCRWLKSGYYRQAGVAVIVTGPRLNVVLCTDAAATARCHCGQSITALLFTVLNSLISGTETV